jgi:membrane protease YdiL (CAAX protease family)
VAGARVETELQLSQTAALGVQRGTIALLLGMLAWIVAALAGSLALAALLAAGSVLLRLTGLASVPEPGELGYLLVATWGFQGTMLLGALWQGRRSGHGDRRAGLGLRPIPYKRRIVIFCLMMVAWLIAVVILADLLPALRAFAKTVTPDFLFGLGHGGPAVAVSQVVLVAVLAPLSEELFFRGWLWEALQRRGHAVLATACLTAMPWLLLHGLDAPGRMVFLLPAAVVFSVARYQGRSVLASLAVHVTNNATAVAMQGLAALTQAQ